MLGTEDDPVHEGLLPRLCKELFELSQELMAEDPNLVVKVCPAGPILPNTTLPPPPHT